MTGIRILLTALLVGLIAASAASQSYPSRPIRVIVAYGPGTVTDTLVRLLGEKVAPEFGQPIVVENRGGAGGAIAAVAVARSAADGHTLLAHTMSGLAFGVAGTTYDPLRDFAGVVPMANLITVIVGAKSAGFGTLQEMVALAKSNPGLLNYASTGPGSPSHLYSEKLKAAAGFEATNVSYKGVAEALADLSTGRVHFFALSLATALPMIRDGRIIPLAITSSRQPSFPLDVPTTSAAGIENASMETGIGLWAPKETPPDIVDRLNREIRKALADQDLVRRLVAMGGEPWPLGPAELDAHMMKEIADTRAMAARLGLRAPPN